MECYESEARTVSASAITGGSTCYRNALGQRRRMCGSGGVRAGAIDSSASWTEHGGADHNRTAERLGQDSLRTSLPKCRPIITRSLTRQSRLFAPLKTAGADAIKLQTYTADTITIACDRKEFRLASGTIWDGTTLYELYGQAYTPWEWQPRLKKVANDLGMDLFSTPFR